MRKVLLLFLTLMLVAFLAVSCGDSSKTSPLLPQSETSLFSFIRQAPSGSTSTALDRHFRTEHARVAEMHKIASAGGLKPFDVEIEPGTDSVVMMKNDGTGETVLANQAGWFDSVQLGYDGKKGVFSARDLSGFMQVFYVDLSNISNPVITQLTSDAEYHYYPQLSRDGTKVIFMKFVSDVEKGQAVIMSPTGGSENVIATPFFVNFPSFAPNGKIVFEEEDNDTINIMNADGTGNTVLTNADHQSYDEFPSVSQDGKTITFSRYPADDSTGENIFSMNIDGTNVKQLTTDSASWDPMFVNDKIVFVSSRDSLGGGTWIGNEIYSMSSDGTNQKRLTNNTVDEYFIY
jgi:Tol biopolymer transport system component